jgi:hypothetical protein
MADGLARAANDRGIRRFPTSFVDFSRLKRRERDRYCGVVTDWERETTLDYCTGHF